MKPTAHWSARVCVVAWLLLGSRHVAFPNEMRLEIRPGDHVCLVGNGLGESLQHDSHWETGLHQRFKQHRLVVRNLCFPADQVDFRLREEGFGSPESQLKRCQASVVIFFFGQNESFAGAAGQDAFRVALMKLIEQTRAADYSGKGPPRLALVSPIAHEHLRDPNLPDGRERNAQLAAYTDVMRDVATATGITFADVFSSTHLQMQDPVRWTHNGIHLNPYGHRHFARILDAKLFGPRSNAAQPSRSLPDAIRDKNLQWWRRHRPVNGYYIYGGYSDLSFRPDPSLTNRAVMQRELEVLDVMVANRDRRVWSAAAGDPVEDAIDDSNAPSLIRVPTNVGLEQQAVAGDLTYLSPEQAIDKFELAEGYATNCFASEQQFPELVNPVQFVFDARGRLWVACMPTYLQPQTNDQPSDKILILEDTDEDGRADRCVTFADQLRLPTGFELGDKGVYVAQSPDLLFLEDLDGDDRVDRQTRRLRGFGSADAHRAINTFVWGPGGGLYFQEGQFQSSHVETPYGPVRLANGGIYRYEPMTERLDVFVAYDFFNPWGHAFNRWGQSFVADASNGANYFATPFSGKTSGERKHAESPQLFEKRFRPTAACEIVSSNHFPESVQGNYLLANCIGEQGIFQHRLADQGSGYIATEVEPLLRSQDRNFRPIDLGFGPNGALYVSDWHNAIVGHLQHSVRDPSRDRAHGRIWRITYPARQLVKPAKIDDQPLDRLIPLLSSDQDETRYRVRRELRKHRSDDVVEAVNRWVEQLDVMDADHEHQLLEALWVHQQHHRVNADLLERLLLASDPNVRSAAVRVVVFWRSSLTDPLAMLARSIQDVHPRVQLETIRACSYFGDIDSTRAAEIALSAEGPSDVFLDYVTNETLNTLDAVRDDADRR